MSSFSGDEENKPKEKAAQRALFTLVASGTVATKKMNDPTEGEES